MTASKQAKLNGFKSLREVAQILGRDESTLYRAFNKDKSYFDALLQTAKKKQERL